MMADPARIKVEDESERSTSVIEEKTVVKTEPEDAATTASTDENKQPSSQEQPKQDPKSVSVYRKSYIVPVEQVPCASSQNH